MTSMNFVKWVLTNATEFGCKYPVQGNFQPGQLAINGIVPDRRRASQAGDRRLQGTGQVSRRNEGRTTRGNGRVWSGWEPAADGGEGSDEDRGVWPPGRRPDGRGLWERTQRWGDQVPAARLI